MHETVTWKHMNKHCSKCRHPTKTTPRATPLPFHVPYSMQAKQHPKTSINSPTSLHYLFTFTHQYQNDQAYNSPHRSSLHRPHLLRLQMATAPARELPRAAQGDQPQPLWAHHGEDPSWPPRRGRQRRRSHSHQDHAGKNQLHQEEGRKRRRRRIVIDGML